MKKVVTIFDRDWEGNREIVPSLIISPGGAVPTEKVNGTNVREKGDDYMKGVARRLAGLLGVLFIAGPILMVCSIVALPVFIVSPSKGEAIFDFALDCCKPFADLMTS